MKIWWDISAGHKLQLCSFNTVCPKCQGCCRKVEELFLLAQTISPGRWGTCFLRWAVFSSLQIYFCSSCWQNLWLLEGSGHLQASSVALSVNIISYFLHSKHIMPTAHLSHQFEGLERSREQAYVIISSLFCARTRVLHWLFHHLAILQIIVPKPVLAAKSIYSALYLIGCGKQSDLYCTTGDKEWQD